jgi:general secretion pathway protein J
MYTPRQGNTVDQSPQQGFTLLEIMVAMVVLTLIMTASFGALRLGERSWETGLERSGKTETLRTVSGVLERLVSQILPMQWQQNNDKFLAFEGDSHQLRFIGPAPSHNGSTGLFEYTLALIPDATNAQLMLYYRLHDPDRSDFAEQGSDRQQVKLVDELRSVLISYYGAPQDKPNVREGWHERWSKEAENYPRLIRIQLAAGNQQDQWPDLYLPVRTALEK